MRTIAMRMLKHATVLAVVGTIAVAASPSFARDRGAIAAGIAAGALIGAAAASAASAPYYPYYYGDPYVADVGPAYVVPGPIYIDPWANTNSLGPNRAHMEHAN
jgi:hypothetical protein